MLETKLYYQQTVNFIRIDIDIHLKFDSHISTLWQKTSNQINALCRFKSLLKQDRKNVIANSFIYSSFSYCSLTWHFCSQRSIKKIENFQKRALRFVLNDSISDYEVLLIHFRPMLPFYIPWKYQKTKGFLVFSVGIKWQY